MLKLECAPELPGRITTMNEHDGIIRITPEDIAAANQLSLHCPICAGTVEKNVRQRDESPVYCTACETLYHQACWEQNGAHCAVLGCKGTTVRRYGALDLEPALVISQRDIARHPPRAVRVHDGRTERLKREEQRRRQAQHGRGFWQVLWQNLLRAIRIWPSDPS
ncbi:MAG: RING finger protein [Anaerolineae bacterium]|nr:RING finger protein [Anaerolineae bacterium]